MAVGVFVGELVGVFVGVVVLVDVAVEVATGVPVDVGVGVDVFVAVGVGPPHGTAGDIEFRGIGGDTTSKSLLLLLVS